MKNFFVTVLCLVFFLASCSMNHMGNPNSASETQLEALAIERVPVSTDYRAPSADPPGGLLPSEVPQFVVLGFDDNQFDDGMINTMNILKGKSNNPGKGNAGTYDGAPMHATYYNNPAGRNDKEEWIIGPETVAQWKAAHVAGHETGNHTYYHDHGLSNTKAQWVEAMTKCSDYFANVVGIPKSEVIGFRTPFLEYNLDTFYAMEEVGLLYDCSFEGGRIYWPAQDGSSLLWPYTMDEGTPPNESGRALPKIKGMWQLPQDCIYLPSGSFVTGFDYNLWFQFSYTKQQFVDALKYSLDKKYYGNRAPMMVGLHSNYYSDKAFEEMKIYDPASVAKLKTTVVERTAALAEFVAYAHSLPDVRIVSAKELLTWLRNPVPLAPKVTFTVDATSGLNGRLDPEGLINVPEGSDLVITARPDAGYTVDQVTVDGAPAALDAARKYTFTAVSANHSINVTFKAAPTYTISATHGPNGTLSQTGDIVVTAGDSLTINALPADGFQVDTITVGTTVYTDITSYTFSNVQANGSIHVTFKDLPKPDVKIDYVITQDWGTGFGANVTITNNTPNAINGWKVVWTYASGDRVTSLWNASFTQTGKTVEVTNLSWNGTIAANGGKVSFGFNGVPDGPAEIPTNIQLIQQ